MHSNRNMMLKVLPNQFADEEQEIWLPACFAIPWFLGQQVQYKRKQDGQTKANGQRKSKKLS